MEQKSIELNNITYNIGDDVYVFTNCNGYSQFSIAKIKRFVEQRVEVTWYYRAWDYDVFDIIAFKNAHPKTVPLHRIIALNPLHTDIIHKESIDHLVYIAHTLDEFLHYKLQYAPYHLFSKYYNDIPQHLLHPLNQEETATESDNDDTEDSYTSTAVPTHSLYSDSRTYRIKSRRLNGKTISLLSSDEDVPQKTKGKPQKANTSSKKKTKSIASNHIYWKKTKKKKKKKKKRKTIPKSPKAKRKKKSYKELLKTPIEENKKYLQKVEAALKEGSFPYPVKDSDHERSPKELIFFMFYVLRKYFGYNGNVLDVTPFKSPVDVCNYKMWCNEPDNRCVFVNPPFSGPTYYISEAIKYVISGGLAVLLVVHGSNKVYWKEMISPYCSLLLNLGSVIFGNHQRQVPYPCSLIFIAKAKENEKEFDLSAFGLCDLAEWTETMKCKEKKTWELLQYKMKNNFTFWGECFLCLDDQSDSDFE